jgi:hypothetical protein
MKSSARARHTDLVLEIASRDQRLMDALSQRPHLLNPYPDIITRLSRRSRKFRRQLDGADLPKPRPQATPQRPRLRLISNGPAA